MRRLIAGCGLVAWLVLGTALSAAPPPMTRNEILDRARPAVGYSYYWGHGCWREDGQEKGSCSGSCPNCSHTGHYGADCSGFVAKVWQVPSASDVTEDLHPYSTRDFRYSETHWTRIDRGELLPADALVYRNSANTAGHVVLYESGDGWGSMWLYEARGCSYGIVHDERSLSSSYVAIRREALVAEQPELEAELVDFGSDATPSEAPDADFWVCPSAAFSFWFEFRNTGNTVWRAGQAGAGGDVQLATESGGQDALVGVASVSLADSSNDEVRSDSTDPPGQECSDAPGCVRTVFGPDALRAHAPSDPGVYVTAWQLEDAEGGRFGPVVQLAVEVRAPDCGDRECGPDPVCGVSCGDCEAGKVCSSSGHCLSAPSPDAGVSRDAGVQDGAPVRKDPLGIRGGCGCRSSHGAISGLWLALLVFLFLRLRRRRTDRK